jgi:2-amino-4-hydroxy-6-hydroxymethyldihydropteridine diphosphokinase
MQDCFIGLGSNLGDRRRNIKKALQEINCLQGTRVIKTSKIIESMPQGGPQQPKYLNAVAKLRTGFSPLLLLKEFKKIEVRLGRKKSFRWGPRVIDLDILLYGDEVIETRNLTVPHPQMLKREFVIKPLLELL